MKDQALQPFRTTNIVFWTTLTFAVLALGAYGYLFYTVQTAGAQIAQLQTETKTLEAQETEVDALKKNLAATVVSQQKLSSYFIDPANIVPLLEKLEGYGRSTNVSVQFNTVEVKSSPSKLDISLGANGSFSDVYRFIALLESAPYEFYITKANVRSVVPVGLVPTGTGPHSSGWEATISLSVVSLSTQKATVK